jgi:hypothetical protein
MFLSKLLSKKQNIKRSNKAGLVNNLNDGMIWGLLPIILFTMHYNIGIITAIYPTVWELSIVYR